MKRNYSYGNRDGLNSQSWEEDANRNKTTPDSKEGLHTQGEWVENPNETAYRSIGIMHIKNERGFLFEEIAEVKFNWDKYPDNPEKVRKESFANAELIVKAVNERKALLDSHRELLNALITVKSVLNGWEKARKGNKYANLLEYITTNLNKANIIL